MNKTKSIAVAIVLAVVLLIGGLLAYFTDIDTKTNVFTIGDSIDISLSESEWVAAKGVGIFPGAVVPKNPVITNESSTTPAYVFATVTVPCYDATPNDGTDANNTVNTPLFTLGTGAATPGTGWALIDTSSINTTDKTITYTYAYASENNNNLEMTILAAQASTPAIFQNVTLEDELTPEQKATAPSTTNIVVNAYGIQTNALGTAETPEDIFDLF